MFNLGIGFLTILLVTSTSLKAQSPVQLTFSEAVKAGLAQNIALRKSQNEITALKMSQTQAKMAYLPNLSANVQAARQDGQQFQLVEDGFEIKNVQADRFSSGLNASLSLFQGFNRVNQLKVASYQLEAQKQGVKRSEQQVVFNIAQQFLQVLLDRKLMEIAAQNIENQKTQLLQIEGFVKAGLRPLADQYSQKALLTQLELDFIEIENTFLQDKALLAQTLQWDPLLPFELNEEQLTLIPAEHEYRLEELFEQALQHRADIRQMSLLERAAERNLASSKSGFMPSLQAFYQYGTQYSSLNSLDFREQFFDLYPNNTVGLNLSIPLFANYVNKAATARARVSLANAELDREALKRTVFQEIQSAYLDYKAAFKRQEVAASSLKAAQEAHKIQEQRYNEGLSDLSELSLAQQNLMEAQSNLEQANYTLLFQQKIIDFFVGTLQM